MSLLYAAVALILVGIVAAIVNRYTTFPDNIRTILNIVLTLIVVGIGLWLINTYVPMAESIKAILNIVVVIAVCVGVLQAVGLWPQIRGLWTNFRHRGLPQ